MSNQADGEPPAVHRRAHDREHQEEGQDRLDHDPLTEVDARSQGGGAEVGSRCRLGRGHRQQQVTAGRAAQRR